MLRRLLTKGSRHGENEYLAVTQVLGHEQRYIAAKDEVFRPCSSVVEHSLGKGEVERSIRSMGTTDRP